MEVWRKGAMCFYGRGAERRFCEKVILMCFSCCRSRSRYIGVLAACMSLPAMRAAADVMAGPTVAGNFIKGK